VSQAARETTPPAYDRPVATSRRLLLAAAAVAGAAATAGCGASARAPARHQRAHAATAPSQAPQRDPTQPPPNVPQRASGPADAGSARVIRAWLRALDSGDIGGAAEYFAQPSKFQNGTPVLTLRSRTDRVAVNLALPCGARAIGLGGNGGFTIVSFLLIERPGAECGAGVGQHARGAIRVVRGKIREWYRLPDLPPRQQVPTGPAI
jgi:hypothetical protein